MPPQTHLSDESGSWGTAWICRTCHHLKDTVQHWQVISSTQGRTIRHNISENILQLQSLACFCATKVK